MNWPEDPDDLPPWFDSLTSTADEAAPDDTQGDIPLQSLVLDLGSEPRVPPPAVDFLRAFSTAREDDVEQFGFGQYLDAVWPDGVPTTVYASNVGSDPDAAPHLRNLLLRPTCEGPLGMAPSVGGLTLGIQVYRRQGKLVVSRVEVTPHVPLRDFEVRVSAPIVWRDADVFMDRRDFDALAGLPFHRAQTRERLTDWRKYLDWKERLVRARQIAVPYAARRWEGDTVLGFLVHEDDLPDRRLAGMELGASVRPTEDEDGDDSNHRRRRRRDPHVTQLGEVEDVVRLSLRDARDRDGWGDVNLTPKHHRVLIRVDEETAEVLGRRGPPEEGQLLSSIAGDLGPLRNQMGGVDRLNNSQGFSPRLADFVFSATSASTPLDLAELADVAGGRSLNPGQREAVAKALAAPDLCLIQGPPGTGKTTVISEICLRATREGKRVLVASQTNLAVDNALGRLSDVPWVRPLRLGDPGRVDEEFRDFLAENVVDRWFATIAEHCRNRMRGAERQETELAARARAAERMERALADHLRCRDALRQAEDEVTSADTERRSRQRAAQQTREAADDLARRGELLEQLTRWASEDAALPPTSAAVDWPAHVARPSGLDPALPVLAALQELRARRGPLEAVLEAIVTARVGAAPDVGAAEELRSLREKKLVLIDSDRDADMQQLRQVNRRIKELEGGGWNEITGRLHRAARVAWPTDAPACVEVVVDALRPSTLTSASLDEARSLVEGELLRARQASEAALRSAEYWRAESAAAQADLEAMRERLDAAERQLARAETSLDRAHTRRSSAAASVGAARTDWDAAWRELWPESHPEPPCRQAVELAERLVAEAHAQQSERLARATRWRGVQGEWVERLGRVSDSDREQLQALYVRHSNVVGMTCNEAGKRKTWQDAEFRPFDIVIVDEVSKATPPELILPLLLGEKAVLVGDHRQLPPMFRERDASFGEAAEEGEVSQEDFERFRRMVTASLFQELFEQAPETIKAMLWTQYRMHPRIMDAVNQFYEGRLEAGPDRETLNAARVHHLAVPDAAGGRLLTPSQNLLWIDTTKRPDGKPAWEEQQGSSKLNRLEVDVVVGLLSRIGTALGARGYGPTRELRISRKHAGRPWAEVVRELAPDLPPETLAELFEERRIRVDGQSQKRDGLARADVTVALRAQKEVGVITFYGAQLKALRRAIDAARAKEKNAFASIELRTNTVDKFQGMEKPIVIASLVRAKRGRLGSFVREFQRINVGLSRAQQLLVVVGAEETWKHAEVPLPPIDGGAAIDVPAYRNILELARLAGGRRLARQVLSR